MQRNQGHSATGRSQCDKNVRPYKCIVFPVHCLAFAKRLKHRGIWCMLRLHQLAFVHIYTVSLCTWCYASCVTTKVLIQRNCVFIFKHVTRVLYLDSLVFHCQTCFFESLARSPKHAYVLISDPPVFLARSQC